MDNAFSHSFRILPIAGLMVACDELSKALSSAALIDRLEKLSKILDQLSSDLKEDNLSNEIYLTPNQYIKLVNMGLAFENEAWKYNAVVGLGTPYLEDLFSALCIDNQEKHRLSADSFQRQWFHQQAKAPRPDKALFCQLQNILCRTAIGAIVDRHLHQQNVPVLFKEIQEDDTLTGAGYFTRVQSAGQVVVCKKKEFTKDYLTEILLHEGWHSRQFFKFPVLFNTTDVVDSFVAMKLIEHDAYAIGRIHNKSFDVTHDRAAAAAHSGTHQSLVESGIEEFGREVLSLEGIDWAFYERRRYSDALKRVVGEGNFRERISASKFMDPDFLSKFFVDPNGQSVLPKAPEAFFEELNEYVATLHEPLLVRAERTARNQHLVLLPDCLVV